MTEHSDAAVLFDGVEIRGRSLRAWTLGQYIGLVGDVAAVVQSARDLGLIEELETVGQGRPVGPALLPWIGANAEALLRIVVRSGGWEADEVTAWPAEEFPTIVGVIFALNDATLGKSYALVQAILAARAGTASGAPSPG